MNSPRRILIVQTAFLGDVVLTLPLVQVLHRTFPGAEIDILAIPEVSEVLQNHPAIHRVIAYDKHKTHRGLAGMVSVSRMLRSIRYDLALVPHRSMRSAIVVAMSRIPVRIGFTTSAGRFLFTTLVRYDKNAHEIERNLAFLKPLGAEQHGKEFPSLYPSRDDLAAVDKFLANNAIDGGTKLVAIAPGSVWNTKRWLPERFAGVADALISAGLRVVLVGGMDDLALCKEIAAMVRSGNVAVAAGTFSILQSAELIRRCDTLVTNDSAPLHLAVAMRTRVVAVFGATVPAFGFAPYGERDRVIETMGLSCRPCSIHGGDVCPIRTFDCMKRISVGEVLATVLQA